MEIAQRWKKNMKPIEKCCIINLSLIQNPTLREKVDRFIVKKMISAKLKLGLGNSDTLNLKITTRLISQLIRFYIIDLQGCASKNLSAVMMS